MSRIPVPSIISVFSPTIFLTYCVISHLEAQPQRGVIEHKKDSYFIVFCQIVVVIEKRDCYCTMPLNAFTSLKNYNYFVNIFIYFSF